LDSCNKIDGNAVLCYVKESSAWFTTRPLGEQRGDDWEDAPYEHNASEPYGPCWHNLPKHRHDPEEKRGWRPGTEDPYEVGELCRCDSCQRDWNEDGTAKFSVFHVYWEGPWMTPDSLDLSLSVDRINQGGIAWLIPTEKNVAAIYAGKTYREFCSVISAYGGLVYEPRGYFS
jgi:hypothetical protein